MGTVSDHYSELLAPIYLWMVGGPEAALSQGAADLSALKIPPSNGAHALDLGAGFGMHAIPLARLGYAVTAIDSSTELLSQLRQLAINPLGSLKDAPPAVKFRMQFVAHQDCLDATVQQAYPSCGRPAFALSVPSCLGCISAATDAPRMRGACVPQDVYGSRPSGRIPVRRAHAREDVQCSRSTGFERLQGERL